MMSSTVVMRGYLGTDPKEFGSGSTQGCSFRLASSRGYYDRKTQQWKDAPTTWISVRAFRTLAANLLRSVEKGDPVIVVGELVTDEWVQEGGSKRSSTALQASAVGHDLNQGVTKIVRNRVKRDSEQPGSVPSTEQLPDPSFAGFAETQGNTDSQQPANGAEASQENLSVEVSEKEAAMV